MIRGIWQRVLVIKIIFKEFATKLQQMPIFGNGFMIESNNALLIKLEVTAKLKSRGQQTSFQSLKYKQQSIGPNHKVHVNQFAIS